MIKFEVMNHDMKGLTLTGWFSHHKLPSLGGLQAYFSYDGCRSV